jgi:hypothetical protein
VFLPEGTQGGKSNDPHASEYHDTNLVSTACDTACASQKSALAGRRCVGCEMKFDAVHRQSIGAPLLSGAESLLDDRRSALPMKSVVSENSN